MPELVPPQLDPAWGDRLNRRELERDVRRRGRTVVGRDSWKLERRQHFVESMSASRDALRRGDWETALRLLEEERAGLRARADEQAGRGSVLRRVRIVEEPLTPYMQWRLHLLRLCGECGESVRVVPSDKIDGAEITTPLPELVVLGGGTLYQVHYTDDGVPDGAVRYTEPALVGRWQRYVQRLHEVGEDVQSYFARKVAHLPAPASA